MTVFEKILRHTLSTTGQPSDELEVIEKELRDTHASLPVVFQPRAIAESFADSPSIIVTRLCVNAIYQKCLCVLHRPYVIHGRQESLQTCYDSSSDLVRQFLDISKEFEPGGQLEAERWFMGSITWHDFLLGCTALCLTVCSTRHLVAEPASTMTIDVVRSLKLLQSAKDVCEKQSARSRDTRKVQRLVEATILRFSDQSNRDLRTTQNSTQSSQQHMSSDGHWEETPSFRGDRDLLWDENTIMPTEDPLWTFMEQILDLPNEELMIDT
jgi:hypothetical protein